MIEKEYVYLLENLSWHKPENVQIETINQFIRIKDDFLYILVQPKDKSCWENAAITLQKIGTPRILIIIPELLKWIKDLTWPGAEIIMDVLIGIDKTLLLPQIDIAMNEAISLNHLGWQSNLRLLVSSIASKN